MSNIYCVIDASSYIYLNQFTFTLNERDTSLYDLLKKTKYLTLKHSRTIADEIKRNTNIDTKEALELDNHVYKFTNWSLGHYDKSIFNNSIALKLGDRGEKENVAVAIDLFLNKKFSIVYLSDDKKAAGETGHLKDVMAAFPYFQIWTSFEVILFLYFSFSNKYFDYSRALDSIQDLLSFVFKPKRLDLVSKRDLGLISNDTFSLEIQKLNAKAQSYKINYTTRIDLIRNLITI